MNGDRNGFDHPNLVVLNQLEWRVAVLNLILLARVGDENIESSWWTCCRTGGAAGNRRMGSVVNLYRVPGLCLRVVKMPSLSLCRITFTGVAGKGDGIIRSR